MEKSTVYFTDFRCPVGTSQLDKLKKLCIAAGIKDIDMDGKFVAIKMHFGELGNVSFLRPNYAKVKAYDENMQEYIIEGTELLARCLCHEIDHLDGVMYVDKATEMMQIDKEDDEA